MDLRDAAEKCVFYELDQCLEHFCLARKVPIQGGFGDANVLSETSRRNPGTRALLEDSCKRLKNLLLARGFLLGHGPGVRRCV